MTGADIREVYELAAAGEGANAPDEITLLPLADLLEEASAFISDYVVFARPAQEVAVCLWIVHTHLFEQFDISPCLAVTSPEKRSGKSRLLDVLQLLVAKPWRAILPSDAVVFRKIEADGPTLLLDEVDAIFGAKTAAQYEGLRALLNAGHRKGATVPRCLERGFQVKDYSVFCPKALAGIGNLPDTVADRSIPIRLARRTKQETVRKFRFREVEARAEPLKTQIESYASSADLARFYPAIPDELNDRAADSWEPLLCIADAAGGKWPELARRAALTLSADIEPDDDSLGIRLLADCREVFRASGADRLPSKNLLERLNDLEESPWNDIGLTARRLASMLKRYGVKPKQLNLETGNPRGYLRSAFADAWNRYLTFKTLEPLETADRAENGNFQSACQNESKQIDHDCNPADRTKQALQADKGPYTEASSEQEGMF